MLIPPHAHYFNGYNFGVHHWLEGYRVWVRRNKHDENVTYKKGILKVVPDNSNYRFIIDECNFKRHVGRGVENQNKRSDVPNLPKLVLF